MAKRLKHTIGTQSSYRFTIKAKGFDGTVIPQPLPAGTFVYFEVERDGVKIIDLDNDPAGVDTGVTIFDEVNGIVDVVVPFGTLPGDEGGETDYGVLVRLDPAGADTRIEPVRGTLEIIPERVDVP